MNKLQALFASQSQGFGKTFLVQHLREFIMKDMTRSDSVVKKLIESPRYTHLTPHITALATTRSIIVPIDKLSVECTSFEEAVVVEVVSQLRGIYPEEVLQEVRERKLKFPRLCDELLAQNNALIIVLDDVMDLVGSEQSAHLAWLHSVALCTDTREQKTRAVMTLLKALLESVLGKPGALLYLTGRAPDITYQLLTTLKSSPLMAHAVLFDALQHAHIKEILTLTRFEKTEVRLFEAIGLRNLQEVDELARWALFHTGGVPRVLTGAFNVLINGEFLGPVRRTTNQSVWDALSSKEVSDELYLEIKRTVPQGIVPNWSELNTVGGWNTELTTASFVKVLDAARENATVKCSLPVLVAQDKYVAAVDLLSVLGVPFKRTSYDTMTVQLGVWSIRAMLESETVGWTRADVLEQLKWMRDATTDIVELARILDCQSWIDAVAENF